VPALGIDRTAVEGDGIGAFTLDLILLCLFMKFRLTLPGFDVHQDFRQRCDARIQLQRSTVAAVPLPGPVVGRRDAMAHDCTQHLLEVACERLSVHQRGRI